MNKAKNVIEFYVLTNKLKNVIRTGWKNWNVNRERIESVAEHIYGVQMLAVAIHSEYQYDLDLKKVLYMLAIHELEEIIIGDLTQFEITQEEKREKGKNAVSQILENLVKKEDIALLIDEFEERKSKEALFSYFCDKLECDIQCKLYDEENCVDLRQQDNNPILDDIVVKELLEKGYSWSQMWMIFSQNKYSYDHNFLEISDYVIKNDISNLVKKS